MCLSRTWLVDDTALIPDLLSSFLLASLAASHSESDSSSSASESTDSFSKRSASTYNLASSHVISSFLMGRCKLMNVGLFFTGDDISVDALAKSGETGKFLLNSPVELAPF